MKNVLKVVSGTALVLIAGYSVYLSQEDIKTSDLVLANVEALANCEVYDKEHNLVANCEGEEGVCYELSENLYCPGKEVK